MRVIIVISLLATVAVQATEIYRWVDEKGAVHFGDRPTTQAAEKITINNSPDDDATYQNELGKQSRLLEIYTEERQEQKQLMEKITEEKAILARNCNLAKNNLNEMKNASYIYEDTDDPFNPRILSNAERTTETTRAEAEVEKWCN